MGGGDLRVFPGRVGRGEHDVVVGVRAHPGDRGVEGVRVFGAAGGGVDFRRGGDDRGGRVGGGIHDWTGCARGDGARAAVQRVCAGPRGAAGGRGDRGDGAGDGGGGSDLSGAFRGADPTGRGP